MYGLSYQRIEFLPEHKQLLRNLVIGGSGPGTILRDFEALLTFLKERDLAVTSKHQLPLRALPEINARLTRPLQLGLKRPMQKSFPHIHGLYPAGAGVGADLRRGHVQKSRCSWWMTWSTNRGRA